MMPVVMVSIMKGEKTGAEKRREDALNADIWGERIFNFRQLVQSINHSADAWRWSMDSCTSRRL